MFTYIKLRNFMSFKEVIFDFRERGNNAKKFISIYGANGSGKSNFINSIEFLLRSINSLSQSAIKESGISDSYCCKSLEENKDIKKYRMLGCNELTSVVYGFLVNSHKGCYCLSFDNKVSRESLEYYEGKQKIKLFGIEYKNGKIVKALSNKLCLTQKVKEGLDSLWGTHTFLSIINKERKNENRWQTQDNLLGYIFDVLDMLQSITIYKSGRILNTSNLDNILKNLCTGEINIKYANMLDSSERILREFFTQTYSDIKDVFYKRTIVGKELRYNLFIRKMIGGKLRMIDFNIESNGTKCILKIIYALLMVFFNNIVIYDDLDNGLHDILLKYILTSLIDDIKGQLIITAHNTCILETIEAKSLYVIDVDYQGYKDIKCLDSYPKIKDRTNLRNLYLKGLLGGVPIIDIIDYDSILEELQISENTYKG